MLKLGPVKLAGKPKVAAVVTSSRDLSSLSQDVLEGVDVFEIRADMFEAGVEDSVSSIRAVLESCRALGKVTLLTVRSTAEGGRRSFSDTERLDLYLELLNDCDGIDIEVASKPLWSELGKACKNAGKLLIGSFHDFEKTPADSVIEEMFTRCRELGGDIFKLACAADGPDDLGRILAFTRMHHQDGVITLSMGQWGLISRVAAPVLGSLLTYGYISASSAPGQLSCADLVKYLRVFCPEVLCNS